MARPLKIRRVGEIEKGTWQTFAEATRDPLPHDPARLRNIVSALLIRFENRYSNKESVFLRSHIQRLAGVERRFPIYSEKDSASTSAQRRTLIEEANRIATKLYQSAEKDVLDILRNGDVPRSPHADDTIIFQRDLLTEFLKLNPYPKIRTTRDRAVKAWLRKNASPIWTVLNKLPCFCTYRGTYEGLQELDLESCMGPANLIHLLLAELHCSTASAIRKVLSHFNSRQS